MAALDAVVVGSGPNGLAAAVTIARAGRSVLVVEAADTIGGGCRSKELTLPGHRHDVCAAVHPLGAGSPFFRSLPLERHGLRWLHPELAAAHPLDGGAAALFHQDLDATVEGLGADGPAYRRLIGPLVERWDELEADLLGPLVRIPRHPTALVSFGVRGLPPATLLARRLFSTEAGRALFAGAAAHAILPLQRPFTSAFGLVLLAAGHIAGWPFAEGGSQAIVDALAAHLRDLGGEILTGHPVRGMPDVPPSRVVLFDVSPSNLATIAADRLPDGYLRRIRRFRHGPGSFKVDLVLDGPIPWSHPEVGRAGTVHVGGTLDEIADHEYGIWRGRTSSKPFVLLTQPSVIDPSRAPDGHHVVWAYCHVPNASRADMREPIEDQIERFAPGFAERVIARSSISPIEFYRYNANYVGGDIAGGSHSGLQLFMRPITSLDPYSTPADGIYLCSASTPPGAGVHGMCGHLAARSALAAELA